MAVPVNWGVVGVLVIRALLVGVYTRAFDVLNTPI